jgi:hypothetical protein
MVNAPWASGPGEILKHAIHLLSEDSDTNRRLAFILIDNAVELTIKTYLGLPRRVTGMRLGRKELEEISENFPALLDALEQYAADKVIGVNIGEIEWFHRLRNQLYHQGNGLTVVRDKVEVYSELAKLLFTRLFGMDLPVPQTKRTRSVGEFLRYWSELEQKYPTDQWTFYSSGWASSAFAKDHETKKLLRHLHDVRNRLVHGEGTSEEELRRAIKELIALLKKLQGEG